MKFAYLIMAHHKFSVLMLLLKDLDDERNDIFVHIDKKAGRINQEELRKTVKNANLIFIPRMAVFWGHYSQIKCIVKLMQTAVAYGYHDYYHFLVGVEFPLKSQRYIYNFFSENAGYEFIGYDRASDFSDRIKYWNIWGKYARAKKKYQIILYGWNKKLLRMQKKIGVNRIKGRENYYKKGYANWSITHELAKYILDEFKQVRNQYRFTWCADEIFIHTVVYHSKYYKKVFDLMDEYHSAMRLTTWEDPHNQLHMSDYEWLIKTDRLFGRKFDDDEAEELIERIKANRL